MRRKPPCARAAFGRSRLIFQPYFFAPGTNGGNAVSAEVSEVALLLKFAFREKAVAPATSPFSLFIPIAHRVLILASVVGFFVFPGGVFTAPVYSAYNAMNFVDSQ